MPDSLIQPLELKVTDQDQESVETFIKTLDDYKPDLVVVGMGKTYNENFTVCEILKKRGINHVVPSAFSRGYSL